MPEVAVFTLPRRHRLHRAVTSGVLALAALTWLAAFVALASGTLLPALLALVPTALWALLLWTRPAPVAELRVEAARLLAGRYRVPAHQAVVSLSRERGDLVLLLETGGAPVRVVLCREEATGEGDAARLKALAGVLSASRDAGTARVAAELAGLGA